MAACGHVWFGPRQLAPCATNPHPHRSLCLARHIISSAISLSSVLPAALTHVMDGDCITPFPPPPKKNPIFIQPALLFFCSFHPFFPMSSPLSLHHFLFSFRVFNLTNIVPCYESVVSAAKPPGDAAAVTAAAAKKQCNTRSRAIRIATIVKNIRSKKWDENEMLTTPISSPSQVVPWSANKYRDGGLFGYQAERKYVGFYLSKSDKCWNNQWLEHNILLCLNS